MQNAFILNKMRFANLNYFPSRKLTLIFLSLLIVGGLLWFANSKKSPPISSKTARTKTETTKLIALETDSDHDGVSDWKEILAGTDPHNPDTDGDGIKDADEKQTGSSPTDTKVDTSNSLTASLFKNLGDIVQSKSTAPEGTEVFDEQSRKALAENLLKEAHSVSSKRYVYTKTDLFIDDRVNAHDFFNNIASIIKKRFAGSASEIPHEGALDLLVELVNLKKTPNSTKEDAVAIIARIQAVRANYIEGAKEIQKIAVPKKYIDLQLGFLNSLSMLAEGLREFALIDSDPMLGLAGYGSFSREFKNWRTYSDGIKKALDAEHVIYEESEPGYLLQKFVNVPKQ